VNLRSLLARVEKCRDVSLALSTTPAMLLPSRFTEDSETPDHLCPAEVVQLPARHQCREAHGHPLHCVLAERLPAGQAGPALKRQTRQAQFTLAEQLLRGQGSLDHAEPLNLLQRGLRLVAVFSTH
jgi:hypothetical protein